MMKAILIDIDGTLLDFDAYVKESMREGFAKFGIADYKEEMYDTFLRINKGLWAQIEQGKLTLDGLRKVRWNMIFSALGLSYDGNVFERYFADRLFESAVPIEGAREALAYLAPRYTLCVASNGPYRQQITRLEKAGMLPYFSHIFVSEKIGASKPSDVFFSHCLSVLAEEKGSVCPSEVWMIGDSLSSDMAGAAQAGIKTCFFDRQKSGSDGGIPLDLVITDLGELLSVF